MFLFIIKNKMLIFFKYERNMKTHQFLPENYTNILKFITR